MRRAAAFLATAMLLVALPGGCGRGGSSTPSESSKPAESLAILSPAQGASVKGNVVTLAVEAKGVSIVKADGDTSGRTGHYHVFIDRDPVAPGTVIPREAGIVHTADAPITIVGLTLGTHRLSVVLGNGAHVRIGAAVAERTVTVEGPSVKASAPATVTSGQPVTISVKVEGLSLVKANGDTSGRSGHLHLFVDKQPTPPGQPIPSGDPTIIHTAETTVTLPNLAPGEHTIWVVAGDGTHKPLEPPVMDKVTLTVT